MYIYSYNRKLIVLVKLLKTFKGLLRLSPFPDLVRMILFYPLGPFRRIPESFFFISSLLCCLISFYIDIFAWHYCHFRIVAPLNLSIYAGFATLKKILLNFFILGIAFCFSVCYTDTIDKRKTLLKSKWKAGERMKKKMPRDDLTVLITSILEYVKKSETKTDIERYLKELLKAIKK